MAIKSVPEATAAQFVKRLEVLSSPEEAKKYLRYFKSGEGEYGEGDVFMGVRMGQVFELAKEHMTMTPSEIEILMESPLHEVRAGAMSIMDKQARNKKTPETRRKELFELYLRRHDRVNNWDLVDLAAAYVIGGYLFDKPRDILYQLAKSTSMWERRTAIVSTTYFIRNNDLADTFTLSEILIEDKEDLVHKATGWMLRFAGQKDRARLIHFLDKHAFNMPRTLLRYSIEHLDEQERAHYLDKKKTGK